MIAFAERHFTACCAIELRGDVDLLRARVDEGVLVRSMIDRDLADLKHEVRAVKSTVQALATTQSEHTRTLSGHTQTLSEHTQTLSQHTQAFVRVETTLGRLQTGQQAILDLLERIAPAES